MSSYENSDATMAVFVAFSLFVGAGIGACVFYLVGGC
jgi:hypothetical protein